MKTLLKFKDFISEGIHNPIGQHAIFLAGAPGSGKSSIARPLKGLGFQEIDSDHAFEFLMRKHGLDPKMPPHEEQIRTEIRNRAKSMTRERLNHAINNKNPIIINGTSRDPEDIHRTKTNLESLGYTTHMVMMHVDNEVSRQRNIRRGERGGRTVPEEVRHNIWNEVSGARGRYYRMFGNNYHELNNSLNHETSTPEERKNLNDKIQSLTVHFEKSTLKEDDEKYSHYDPKQWHEDTLKDEYYDIMDTF